MKVLNACRHSQHWKTKCANVNFPPSPEAAVHRLNLGRLNDKFCTTDRGKLTPHSTLDSRKVFLKKKNLKSRENAKCKKCKDNQKKNRKEKKKKLYMRLCGLNGCYRLWTRKAKETRLMKFLAIHSFIHSINIFTGFKILSSVLWWLLVHSNRTNS